jgi:predicted Zn-dependent peptidase
MRTAEKKAPAAVAPVVPDCEHPVHRSRLDNGLRVIVIPQPHLHSAALTVSVHVGARHEDARSSGLGHLLEHMLFRGTCSHPSAHELNLAIEQLGASGWGVTYSDHTLLGLTLPPENAEQGLRILSELLLCPRFEDLEVEKRIVREEILQSLDENGRNVDVDDIGRKLLFGSHPLGYTIGGSAANVDRFGIGDLQRHRKRYYVAENMVLCAAGAVDPQALLRGAERCLSAIPRGEHCRPSAPAMAENGPRFRYVESPGSQSDLRILFPTWGEADSRRMALQLLVRVMDDGMSTRLQRRIVDELGLAYEVFAVLELYQECGVFGVGATAEHGKVPALVRETLGLLGEMTRQQVPAPELDKARRRYRWSLRASLDNAESMCSHYGTMALFDLDGHLQQLADSASRVTASELRKAAVQIIRPQSLHVACVGMLDRRMARQTREATYAFGSAGAR